MQPQRQAIDFVAHDTAVARATERGIALLALLTYAPGWANGGRDRYHEPAADMVAHWRDFCERIARRYLPRGVSTYELWNEANIRAFYRPAPNVATYVSRVLVPGAAGIRRAAARLGRRAVVLSSRTAPAVSSNGNIAPADFMAGVYRHGGGDAFDHGNHHPHTYPFPPSLPGWWNAMLQTRAIREVMVRNADAHKQVWGTEVGFPSRDRGPHYPDVSSGTSVFVSHRTPATRVGEVLDQ